METAIAFIGAAALALGVHELMERIRGRRGPARIPSPDPSPTPPEMGRLPAYAAPLVVLWPSRFHPERARGRERVLDRLRRAGYPYPTVGAYYAAAVLGFARSMMVAAIVAAAMVISGLDPLMSLIPTALLAVAALRRPEARLRQRIRERARAFRANAVVGLSALHAFLESGLGPAEAMRRVGEAIGGPFCNWLGFLAARMEVEDLNRALERAADHLPDPNDVEMALFLQALRDHFEHGMPLAPAVAELREELRRDIADETAARAALIRRRAGLAGFLANVGLALAFILPVMTGGLFAMFRR